jgi:hypothetical protein
MGISPRTWNLLSGRLATLRLARTQTQLLQVTGTTNPKDQQVAGTPFPMAATPMQEVSPPSEMA